MITKPVRVGLFIGIVLGATMVAVDVDLPGEGPKSRLDGGSAVAQAPDDLEYGFLDQTSGNYLLVQWGATHESYGHFLFTAPGLGAAWPDGPATISTTPTGYSVSYSGTGRLDAEATVNTVFGSTFEKSGESVAVPLSLTMTVDAQYVVASATVTVGGQPLTVTTTAAAHDAHVVVAQLVTAMRDSEWAVLHGMLYSEFRNGVSLNEFGGAVQATIAAKGTLVGGSLAAPLDYLGEPGAGYRLARGHVQLSFDLNGVPSLMLSEVTFIQEQGSWKLLTLDPPEEAMGLPGFTLFPPPNHDFEFPAYPVGTPPSNHDFQAAAVTVGTPPSNGGFDTPGHATGTPATNSDLEAAVVDTFWLQNHDFATGDFTGWATTGTVLIESNGTQGSYARLNSPGAFVRTEPFTVTAATQAAQFDVGHINASGYSWVKVFIETGATYSTSTQLGQYYCSSCNTWVTILQNLSAYQGQSVRLRFEQYSTFTAGIDNVRLLEYVPSTEILGSVARASESGNGYVVLDTGGTVTTGPVVVPSDAQYVTMKVRGQSAGDDRFNLQVKSGATFATESNLLWYISASDGGWATVRADLSAYRGQTVKFRAGRAAGVVAVDDIGLMRVELADYTTKGDVALTAESGNSYALLAGSGTEVITAPFTVDAASQTIGLSVRGATTGNDQYTVYVQSGASFATETSVLWFQTAADGPWQPVAFSASQYAGQVIRLRILRSGGSVGVDDIGVMTAILPGFALEGTVERLVESGNVVAQLASGSKMTTAPFTVSLSAQQLTVRAKNTGASASTVQVHVLSGPTYETSTQVASTQVPAASGWMSLSFDAVPFAGESVRVRVQAVTGSPTVDEAGVATVTVPSWAASGAVLAITGAPTGAYVALGGSGTITSEAAQLPGSAQTLSVKYANGAASGSSYFYVEMLRGPEFAQVQQLGFVTAGQSQGQWASFNANISAYAGEVVKLRIRRYTGEVWVDDAGVVVP